MECIRKNKERNILMVGLCSAGKTQILHILQQHDEQFYGRPTVGFNLNTVEYKDSNLMIWDVGGSDKIRRLWKYFIPGTHGLIFVVDSTDRERVTEAGDELHRLLNEEPKNRNQPLLVFANRQDGPDPMTADEIAQKLGLHSLRSRLWHIQSSCAPSGDGLYDGLDWLLYNISRRRKIRPLARSICLL